MPFGCIFVANFPVEAILRAEPDLRSRAVAVLEGKPPLQKIVSVNEKARDAGVSLGMTKLQIEGCTEIALRDRSELQESTAHQALLDCAHSFSPRVEGAALDTVLLDLSGLDSLFGPLAKIAREISHRASSIGLQTNVAVAHTLDAALLAARGFIGELSYLKVKKPRSWAVSRSKCCLQTMLIPMKQRNFRKHSDDGESENFAISPLCPKLI